MKLGRPCVDAPTPEQWDLIMSRLAARTITVTNAWTWLLDLGYTMSSRAFERLLQKEKTRRLACERDEALAATPSAAVLVAVPLGADFAHSAAQAEPPPGEATARLDREEAAKRPRLADVPQGADGSCTESMKGLASESSSTLRVTPSIEAAASGGPAAGEKEPCDACAKARDVFQATACYPVFDARGPVPVSPPSWGPAVCRFGLI